MLLRCGSTDEMNAKTMLKKNDDNDDEDLLSRVCAPTKRDISAVIIED